LTVYNYLLVTKPLFQLFMLCTIYNGIMCILQMNTLHICCRVSEC